jgi:membrane associated rhomboid family serine protease
MYSILYTLRSRPVSFVIIGFCLVNFFRIHSGSDSASDMAIECGAWYRPDIERGQWWRMLTTGLVHIQLWHLLMNLYAFYSLSYLESYFGEIWFTVILLGSVFAGSLLQYRMSNTILSVGLSGGLYGLMTAEFIVFLSMGMLTSSSVLYSFIPVVITNLLINFMPGIAWQAHLGGAIAGAVLAVIMMLL